MLHTRNTQRPQKERQRTPKKIPRTTQRPSLRSTSVLDTRAVNTHSNTRHTCAHATHIHVPMRQDMKNAMSVQLLNRDVEKEEAIHQVLCHVCPPVSVFLSVSVSVSVPVPVVLCLCLCLCLCLETAASPRAHANLSLSLTHSLCLSVCLSFSLVLCDSVSLSLSPPHTTNHTHTQLTLSPSTNVLPLPSTSPCTYSTNISTHWRRGG